MGFFSFLSRQPEIPSYILTIGVNLASSKKAEWTSLTVFELKKEGLSIIWDPASKEFASITNLDERWEGKRYGIFMDDNSIGVIDNSTTEWVNLKYNDITDFTAYSIVKDVEWSKEAFVEYIKDKLGKEYFEWHYGGKKPSEERNIFPEVTFEIKGHRHFICHPFMTISFHTQVSKTTTLFTS